MGEKMKKNWKIVKQLLNNLTEICSIKIVGLKWHSTAGLTDLRIELIYDRRQFKAICQKSMDKNQAMGRLVINNIRTAIRF